MKPRTFLVSFELTFDGDYWDGDSRLGPEYVSNRLGDTLRLGIEDSRMGPIKVREVDAGSCHKHVPGCKCAVGFPPDEQCADCRESEPRDSYCVCGPVEKVFES